MQRKPIVNGKFYPDNKNELIEFISKSDKPTNNRTSAKAIILPHAGYPHSGKVAATTVGEIMPKSKVIILGTNHNQIGAEFALWAKGSWETPLGNVTCDQELSEKILQENSYILEDYLAHVYEHSIEVQLPILQYFFKSFEIVPISCKLSSLDIYKKVAAQIANVIKRITKEKVLLIASTDLTHYEPELSARKKDRLALNEIVNLDGEKLVNCVEKNQISMCGLAPVATLLFCVKMLGATKAYVTQYQTSAETTKDSRAVVGYAGVVIQ